MFYVAFTSVGRAYGQPKTEVLARRVVTVYRPEPYTGPYKSDRLDRS